MSDPRAIKTIYLNEEAFSRGVLSGTTWHPAQPLVFYRGTQSLIRAHIMLADGSTYFKPPAGATWLAGFDNVFTADHTDLVTSLNADFVAADWADADFANGKVCWRMNWTTTALKSVMANDPSLSGWMCLWMTPSGEDPVLIAQWSVVVNNIAVDPTSATAQEGIVFVTTDMLSVYQKQHADQARIVFQDGKIPYIYCEDDGLYYPITVKRVDGSPTFAPGTGISL